VPSWHGIEGGGGGAGGVWGRGGGPKGVDRKVKIYDNLGGFAGARIGQAFDNWPFGVRMGVVGRVPSIGSCESWIVHSLS